MDSKTSKRIKFPKDETFLGEQETEDTFTYTASFWVWIRLLRAENLLGKDSLYSDQEKTMRLCTGIAGFGFWIWIWKGFGRWRRWQLMGDSCTEGSQPLCEWSQPSGALPVGLLGDAVARLLGFGFRRYSSVTKITRVSGTLCRCE